MSGTTMGAMSDALPPPPLTRSQLRLLRRDLRRLGALLRASEVRS